MTQFLRPKIPPSRFTARQLKIGRDLLRDPQNYDLLLDRLTEGGPAVTALLINDGLIQRDA